MAAEGRKPEVMVAALGRGDAEAGMRDMGQSAEPAAAVAAEVARGKGMVVQAAANVVVGQHKGCEEQLKTAAGGQYRPVQQQQQTGPSLPLPQQQQTGPLLPLPQQQQLVPSHQAVPREGGTACGGCAQGEAGPLLLPKLRAKQARKSMEAASVEAGLCVAVRGPLGLGSEQEGEPCSKKQHQEEQQQQQCLAVGKARLGVPPLGLPAAPAAAGGAVQGEGKVDEPNVAAVAEARAHAELAEIANVSNKLDKGLTAAPAAGAGTTAVDCSIARDAPVAQPVDPVAAGAVRSAAAVAATGAPLKLITTPAGCECSCASCSCKGVCLCDALSNRELSTAVQERLCLVDRLLTVLLQQQQQQQGVAVIEPLLHLRGLLVDVGNGSGDWGQGITAVLAGLTAEQRMALVGMGEQGFADARPEAARALGLAVGGSVERAAGVMRKNVPGELDQGAAAVACTSATTPAAAADAAAAEVLLQLQRRAQAVVAATSSPDGNMISRAPAATAAAGTGVAMPAAAAETRDVLQRGLGVDMPVASTAIEEVECEIHGGFEVEEGLDEGPEGLRISSGEMNNCEHETMLEELQDRLAGEEKRSECQRQDEDRPELQQAPSAGCTDEEGHLGQGWAFASDRYEMRRGCGGQGMLGGGMPSLQAATPLGSGRNGGKESQGCVQGAPAAFRQSTAYSSLQQQQQAQQQPLQPWQQQHQHQQPRQQQHQPQLQPQQQLKVNGSARQIPAAAEKFLPSRAVAAAPTAATSGSLHPSVSLHATNVLGLELRPLLEQLPVACRSAGGKQGTLSGVPAWQRDAVANPGTIHATLDTSSSSSYGGGGGEGHQQHQQLHQNIDRRQLQVQQEQQQLQRQRQQELQQQGAAGAGVVNSLLSGGGSVGINLSGFGEVGGPLAAAIRAVLLSKGPITSNEVHDEESALAALNARLGAIRQHLEANGWCIHDGQLQPVPQQQQQHGQSALHHQQQEQHQPRLLPPLQQYGQEQQQRQQQQAGMLVRPLLRHPQQQDSKPNLPRQEAGVTPVHQRPLLPPVAGTMSSARAGAWGQVQCTQHSRELQGAGRPQQQQPQPQAWQRLQQQQQRLPPLPHPYQQQQQQELNQPAHGLVLEGMPMRNFQGDGLDRGAAAAVCSALGPARAAASLLPALLAAAAAGGERGSEGPCSGGGSIGAAVAAAAAAAAAHDGARGAEPAALLASLAEVVAGILGQGRRGF